MPSALVHTLLYYKMSRAASSLQHCPMWPKIGQDIIFISIFIHNAIEYRTLNTYIEYYILCTYIFYQKCV